LFKKGTHMHDWYIQGRYIHCFMSWKVTQSYELST